MSRFYAPDDSITEQSVRQAHNYEYMVPIETSWEIEQALNKAREDCHRLRLERRAADAELARVKNSYKQTPTHISLLTIVETAEVFAVCERTIYNWIASGLLTAIKIGGVVRIRRSDVEKLMGGAQ